MSVETRSLLFVCIAALLLSVIVPPYRLPAVQDAPYKRAEPRPREFAIKEDREWLIIRDVDEKGRFSEINRERVIGASVYPSGVGPDQLGHPTVSVIIPGGSFRLDCKTIEDASEIARLLRQGAPENG